MASDFSGDANKAGFLAQLADKRRAFALEPVATTPEGTKALGDLELLVSALEGSPGANFTPTYCQSVLQNNPILQAPTLAKALQKRAPVKATRRRHVAIHRCEECDGPIAEGVCTRCGHSMKVIDSTDWKAKSSSDTQDKMQQFESDLDILLAISPLPQVICDKVEAVKAVLRDQGVEIRRGEQIPSAKIRYAFSKVGLQQHYIWCIAMGYHLTGWRPAPFSKEDRDLLRSYLQRAIQAFFKRMHSSDGKPAMSNLWCIQAILRLVILSSETLLNHHEDFYRSLHSQGSVTEQAHGNVWQSIVSEEEWTFR